MKTNIKVFITLISIISMVMPLSGCSPTISKEDVEKELVTFMLDYILQLGTDEKVTYVQTSGEPWLNPPPSAKIIIFLPPNSKKPKSPWDYLNGDRPIKVWWYFDNKLVETTDKEAAIREWEKTYMDISWPYRYEFGIFSLSNHNRSASIYFSASSCSECAGGRLIKLKRNASGQWVITKEELLWLS